MDKFRKLILWNFLMVLTLLTNRGFTSQVNIKAIYCSEEKETLSLSNEEIIKSINREDYGFYFWIFNERNGQLFIYDLFFDRLKSFETLDVDGIIYTVNESFINNSNLYVDMTEDNTNYGTEKRDIYNYENYRVRIDLIKKEMYVESLFWLPHFPYCKFVEIPHDVEIIE